VGLILAFIAGFFLGGRAGSQGLDDVIAAARAVADSEEVEALLGAVRSHASHTLTELARRLDGTEGEPISMTDLMDRARNLVGRGATGSAS
jgi:uncharacterized protein YbjT (DUF2867 family)